MQSPTRRILIVTGLSGSGKSTVLNALEDLGYFTIDNLPILFLEKFLELADVGGTRMQLLAIGMDSRDADFVERYATVLPPLLNSPARRVEILFLEARKSVLIRRFSETRRKHPLVKSGSVQRGIEVETTTLQPLRELAHLVIDTTSLNVHELKRVISARFGETASLERKLRLHLISFGFRYGLPQEADMVVDVRFLPNPHFIDSLKKKSGLEPEIQEFVLGQHITATFLEKLLDFVRFLLPLYEKEGKYYFHLAIGCTGGKHRSVALAERIGEFLRSEYPVEVTHNDLDKND